MAAESCSVENTAVHLHYQIPAEGWRSAAVGHAAALSIADPLLRPGVPSCFHTHGRKYQVVSPTLLS